MTTSRRLPPARARASGQRGFTLVELIVAMAAGLVVSLAAFLLSKNATRFFQNETRASASHLAATIGLNRLAADLQRAAYLSTPNILVDPDVCQVPPTPIGLRHLAGISILRGGSVIRNAPDHGQSNANELYPDSIVIGGSLSSTELFEFRNISDASGTLIVELNPNSAAVQRTLARANGSGQGLLQIFAPDRILRVMVRGQTQFQYGVIESATVQGAPPTLTAITITLKLDPGLPRLEGLARCGVTPGGNTGDGGWVNVVNRVRYEIRSLRTAGTPYTPLVTPIAPAQTGDDGRTELVRVELDDADQPILETTELIAEYAVDLKFGISIANEGGVPGVTNPSIERFPITAIDDTNVYNIAAENSQSGAAPQRVRSVQVRLSTRTRAPDRDADLPGGPDGRRRRFLIPGIVTGVDTLAAAQLAGAIPAGAPPVFARMRTLYADIALPNQAYVTW
ncbi:prepilin-type N-terminal cleavage/methylation domain-containing protein [Sorangium sp. So ce590]|uniref:PilW family protein n=1 Tax=Sorangium sp. So ce590 TaxID=3133317 RepID=UPI003F5EDA4A